MSCTPRAAPHCESLSVWGPAVWSPLTRQCSGRCVKAFRVPCRGPCSSRTGQQVHAMSHFDSRRVLPPSPPHTYTHAHVLSAAPQAGALLADAAAGGGPGRAVGSAAAVHRARQPGCTAAAAGGGHTAGAPAREQRGAGHCRYQPNWGGVNRHTTTSSGSHTVGATTGGSRLGRVG